MMGFSREQQRLVWEWTAKAPQKGRRQGPFILKAGGSGRGGATLGRTGFSGAQNAHFLMVFGSRAAEGSDRPGSVIPPAWKLLISFWKMLFTFEKKACRDGRFSEAKIPWLRCNRE